MKLKWILGLLFKLLKFSIKVFGVVLLLVTAVYLFILMHPDIKDFDDSGIKPFRSKYADNDFPRDFIKQNGYKELVLALSGYDTFVTFASESNTTIHAIFTEGCLPNDYSRRKVHAGSPLSADKTGSYALVRTYNDEIYQTLTMEEKEQRVVEFRRNPPPRAIKALHDDYDYTIEKIRHIMGKYSHFEYPNDCMLINDKLRWYCDIPYAISMRDYVDILITFAWGDIREGKYKEASDNIELALKITDAIEKSHSDMFVYSLATGLKKFVSVEFSAMLDSGMMDGGHLLAFLNIYDKYLITKDTVEANIRFDYARDKKFFLDHGGLFPNDLNDYKAYSCMEYASQNEVLNMSICRLFISPIIIRPKRTLSYRHDLYESILKEIRTMRYYHASFLSSFPSEQISKLPSQYGPTDIEDIGSLLGGNMFGEYETAIMWTELRWIPYVYSRTSAFYNLQLLRLATLLYYKQHGALPSSLSMLAPEYIREVPLDPFSGEQFVYVPERNLIYSIGSNGKDDHGSDERINERSGLYDRHGMEKDIVTKILTFGG